VSLLQRHTERADRARRAAAAALAGGDGTDSIGRKDKTDGTGVINEVDAINETDASDGAGVTDATGASGLPASDATGHVSIVTGRPASEWWAAAGAEGKIPVGGRFSIGGQRHFYLETHAAHAAPVEGGGLRVTCGHQNPTLTQVRRRLQGSGGGGKFLFGRGGCSQGSGNRCSQRFMGVGCGNAP
jgi:hypothetical protein